MCIVINVIVMRHNRESLITPAEIAAKQHSCHYPQMTLLSQPILLVKEISLKQAANTSLHHSPMLLSHSHSLCFITLCNIKSFINQNLLFIGLRDKLNILFALSTVLLFHFVCAVRRLEHLIINVRKLHVRNYCSS